MTETPTNGETQKVGLGALLAQWAESPSASLSQALTEAGSDVEALEAYARGCTESEDVEALRRVLVQSAQTGVAEDAALLARFTPILDPRERAWDRLLRAKTSGEILTAVVTEAVKGGVVVDLGVRGFVPSSQLGLNNPKSLNQYLGRPLKLRVLEVNRQRHTVILTNRQIMEEERTERRRTAMEKLKSGQDREGVVRRLTEIGAFVDVGGVDGLLHISEISWKRIERPSDVLKVGQKIRVHVLKVDPEQGRISLSMRRLMADPWEEARRKYSIGATVKVKIGSTVAQGAVVELDEGLDGFIPISELAGRRINSPEEVVQPGQEVDAVVIDLRPRERKIVFSLRKLEQKRERQVVENFQRKARSTSERTTLGDLFGHLFEEFRQEPEPEPEEGAVAAPEGADAEPGGAESAAEAATADLAATGAEAADVEVTDVEPIAAVARGDSEGLAASNGAVPAGVPVAEADEEASEPTAV